ncbi:MAG: hypothetical protein FNNCIFGK_01531 [Bacteroidia bacterium]|nr:hypothetical protein [Bacteroidia bacterium]
MVLPLGVIFAAGGLTAVVVMALDVCTQPSQSVAVTEYVPLVLTVMSAVVSLLLHKNEAYSPGSCVLSVTLPGMQKVVGPPAVITAGAGLHGTLKLVIL